MKLLELRIENFRCYKDEFIIGFDSLTAIIAKNDVGKSSVLEALDAFFNLDKLDPEDRSVGVRSSEPIAITCVFDDIPTQLIVDTDNLISPFNEYLLNADNKLEVKKVFVGSTPKVEFIYLNAIHPTAVNFNDLFTLTIGELRTRARELDVDFTNVNRTIKSSLRHAIWTSVEQASLSLNQVNIEIKDTVWKPLQNTLPLYQLFKADRPSSDQDAEAQDPIKFAIKEALSSKADELEAISEFVKARVEQLTLGTIEKLREMDADLARELNPEFSAFNWNKVFSVSLTNEGQIPLNKRGSGVRRLFLINFFRAKAEQQSLARSVHDVIFAIEEPETSQHPSNQLLLLNALRELADDQTNQVIFTTHNPLIAAKLDSTDVRFIQKNAQDRRHLAPNTEATFSQISANLGIIANHSIRVFIGVEGPNDIEFLNHISEILSATESDIPNLKSSEIDGTIVYIPMGGSTLQLWTNRLAGLNVPEVHIMDRDTTPPAAPKYEDAANRVNARGGNTIAFTTSSRETENYIHVDSINEEFNLQLATPQPFDDIPEIVAQAVHTASGSTVAWAVLNDEKKSQKISRAKKRLNQNATRRMTVARLNEVDTNNDVRTWLRQIKQYLEL